MEPVPALVTLHVWRVPQSDVPRALARMAVDRRRARTTPGCRFAKLLGTGALPRQSDPTRWAKLATWTSPADDPVADAWGRLATETLRLTLRPLRSTGTWSGRRPFGTPTPDAYAGPTAVLTRARIRPGRARAFWAAVPPVAGQAAAAEGLRAHLAVGEAPVGLQGTLSLWDSPAAADAFRSSGAHLGVMTRTASAGWYAEELFARFAVESVTGTLDGRAPFA